MMIQTLNPYSTRSKTAEIMSRYRPIAPKPDVPMGPTCENPSMSEKISQSPYLRNVWPHLQARPTRTRKRGRTALAPPTFKRLRTHALGLSSPFQVNTSPAKNLSFQGFAHGLTGLPPLPIPSLAALNDCSEKPAQANSNLVTLPLLPSHSSLPTLARQATALSELNGDKGIDLNLVAENPEEKDLLQQLQGLTSTNVIAPQPVRPVGSSISVGCISEDPSLNSAKQVPRKPEEVEEEVESEALPTVVSDSNNKVRMANSAYKEMVGQPECSWLDCMVACDGRHGAGACKRICGQVMLQFLDSCVPVSSNGFSCWVRIEWGSNGKKSSINAFSDVMRLSCESKDYLFAWRFHTREASESCSNV